MIFYSGSPFCDCMTLECFANLLSGEMLLLALLILFSNIATRPLTWAGGFSEMFRKLFVPLLLAWSLSLVPPLDV